LSRRLWQAISVVLDVAFINLGIVLAFWLRFSGRLPAFNFQAYTNLAGFISLILVGCLYVFDLYKPEKQQGSGAIIPAVVKAVSLGLIFTTSLTFFVRLFSFPRLVFFLSWLTLIILLSSWRLLGAKLLKINWPEQKVLVVGTNELAKQVLEELKLRSDWGYKVVGVVSRKPSYVGRSLDGTKVIGVISDLVSIIQEKYVDRVIVATPMRQRELLEELSRTQRAQQVKVEVVPELYEILIGRIDYNLLSDIPLIQLTKEPVPSWVKLSKNIFDRLLSALLLLVFAPVMLICALIIKLTSKGPVFYKQERVGQNEKLFWLYKFRTMIDKAEAATGPVLATEDDQRITPIGRFLRRYRLDELPQLFNILKGEMSFVGPRPERPFFVKQFKKSIPGYAERFLIKPGLTGLAQVSGSYATTPANKLKYDLIYLYNQSLFLDIKILFSTFKVVLTASGR